MPVRQKFNASHICAGIRYAGLVKQALYLVAFPCIEFGINHDGQSFLKTHGAE
jgi:hypothetical protein